MQNVQALASDIVAAYTHRQTIQPFTSRDAGFDLETAYLVEAELVRLRSADGHAPVGRKVGFANKALWRILKLDTLVWAHMYDDTVRDAKIAEPLSLARMCAPKIEPEIVFRMKTAVNAEAADAAAILEAVEWLAPGFEIVDSVFIDWRFQPADFVAAYGLHAALVVGEPRHVEPHMIPALVEQLQRFKVRLMKDGQVVEEGSGRNALRSPALSLAELASAVTRPPCNEPLAAGELVSTGTLTEPQPIAPDQEWTMVVDDLDLQPLSLHITV